MATTDRPDTEPVTRAGTIAGAVAGVIITVGGLARALGWLTTDVDVAAVARQVSDLILGAGALWATLAPLMLALHARSKVTPLSDPRDTAGNQLVVAPALPVASVAVPTEDVVEETAPRHAAPETAGDGQTPVYDEVAAELAAAPTAALPAVAVADETRPMQAVAAGIAG